MEIKEQLESLVLEFEPGAKIPSERTLATQFGIARMTLRQSIESLILEGKLERRPGSGTYTTNQGYSLSAGCRSFASEMESQGLKPSNRLVSYKIVSADRVTARKLRIPSSSKVIKFSRVRFGDSTPMAIQLTKIPLAYTANIDDHSEFEGSLEDLLLRRFGIRITTSQTEVSGEFPDKTVANLLEVSKTTPCLVKETIDIDQRARIIMWNKTWYNAEKFRIRFDAACNVRNIDSTFAS
jgi:GntR family transcriptional regulator